MSYTKEKLEYLNATKALIRQAIEDKGQSVSDTDTFRSYADKITAIVTGGSISGDDDSALTITRGAFSTGSTGVYEKTIEHSLGKVPDFVMVFPDGYISSQFNEGGTIPKLMYAWGIHSSWEELFGRLGSSGFSAGLATTNYHGIEYVTDENWAYIRNADAETFTVGVNTSENGWYEFEPNVTYCWVALSGLGGSIEYPSAEEVAF